MDNQQMGSMGMMSGEKHVHCKWHWLHEVVEWKARIFSILSGLFLVLAWVSTFRGTVFGLIAPHWYWSALILGLLALCVKVIWAKDCDNKC